MKDLFISRKKLYFKFWRQNEKWSMLYHFKANQNYVKKKSKPKQRSLTWYINWLMNPVMGSYISFRTPWDFRVTRKGKISILRFIRHASDNFLPCFNLMILKLF